MKQFAMFGLYVASVALAVGIGAWQVGVVNNLDMLLGSTSECKQGLQDEESCPDEAACGNYYPGCKSVPHGTGADSCGTNSSRCQTTQVGCNYSIYAKDHYTLTWSECDAE